ncbi:fungal-specific transcription factor domain-containing protein [Amylocarpus encephaloides]|uniref:Fungal-specific transcription factor domain-containing protein n=1 Tax=Amylocarpus encephaloides TaxID=45428 RepID=A0A9P7YHP9_9HELO|nr:fungal-specific transcription factor domain-containing protein [Amylocarpus encephaloides]
MDQMHHHDPNGFQMPQISAPPLMNPPPQIFGAYTQDGLPHMPDLSQGIFGDGILLDESSEAKRRRIARACDMCRKKKIKCDGKMPACTHCINYKTECVFTQVEKKRNPPKGAKYIEGLENRLGRMESLLKLSGLLKEDDNGRTDLGTLEKRLAETQQAQRASQAPTSGPTSPSQSSPGLDQNNTSTPRSILASPEPENRNAAKRSSHVSIAEEEVEPKQEGVEELSDMMCSLVTNNCGETRYIGSSSGFSIFSPKGISWVNEKTGNASFQEMISSASVDENKYLYWKPEVFGDLFQRRIFRQLPPKNECLSLMKDYFENMNCMFPLFHQPTFMHLVDRQYSRDPYEGSGWWASLNVVLSLAHRLRVMSNLVPAEEDDKAWGYMKNALAVVSELTMRNTDLLSVQALLGMAVFMQGSPNQQPFFFLVAAAIRLSHSIGLHKRGSGFNLNPVEIEQRKRVFWIGYMLDKDICLRSGRPPAQDDDDMNVELPNADPDDNIGNIPLADGKGKVNLFRLMCEFGTIESKVYRQLYSTKAAKQSDGELLNTIGDLDRQLEEWKDSIPIDFRPEHEIKASHTPLILHVVVLHFTYYNCLTTIHRMSIHHGYWTSRLSNYAIQGRNARPLNPRVFSSAALCVSAARASIHLIKYVPQGDFASIWLILYFPVSALVTLFGNILQNPQDPRARADVRLMNLVVSFLSMLSSEEENGGVKRMLGICTEFERIAKVVLDKTEKEASSRRKRKSDTDHVSKGKQGPPPPPMPSVGQAPNLNGVFSPGMAAVNIQQNGFGGSPMGNHGSPQSDWQNNEYGSDYPTPTPGMTPFQASMASMEQMGYTNPTTQLNAPLNMNSFQPPFVPQDLWQMPMTLEWDWASMTGGEYPSFENGVVGDPSLHTANNQHLQNQPM